MKIVLVCIAKDEDDYLQEWLDWHFSLGFDEAFVYENNWRSSVCKDCKRVHFIPFDGPVKQLEAYQHFMNVFSKDFDWAAFIDVDEFIMPRQDVCLRKWLVAKDPWPSVGLNWRLFGDSFLSGKPQSTKSVLQRFHFGAKTLNKHVKQIVNLEWFRLLCAPMPHFLTPHCTSIASVSASKKQHIFSGPFQEQDLGQDHDFELWHFVTKTYEELEKKIARGRADAPLKRDIA